MLYWLDSKYLVVKWKMKRALKELCEDERGLSGVVVAVLLILIAVLAISFLWGGLSKWIGAQWGRISGTEFAEVSSGG